MEDLTLRGSLCPRVRAQGPARAAPEAQLPSQPARACPQGRAVSVLLCLWCRVRPCACSCQGVSGVCGAQLFLCRDAPGLFGSGRTRQS